MSLPPWLLRRFAAGALLLLLPPSAKAAEGADKVIPRVELKGATLTECFDFIHAQGGVNIVLLAPASEEARFTTDLTDVPALEAVRAIADQAGLKVVEDPHALVVAAHPVARPQLALTPALENAESIIVPKILLREATCPDSIDFLHQKSVQLDPEHQGVRLAFAPGAERPEARVILSLSNIPLSDAVWYVAQLSGLEMKAEADRLVLTAPVSPAPVAESKQERRMEKLHQLERKQRGQVEYPPDLAASPIYQKATRLILPKAEFREATVPQALSYLNRQAQANDPDRTGVKMVLQPGAAPDARLTFSLSNVPLSEALRYVAALAGLKVTAGPDALVLVPVPFEPPAPGPAQVREAASLPE